MDCNLSPPSLSGLIAHHPLTPHSSYTGCGVTHQIQGMLMLSWLCTDGSLCRGSRPFTPLLSTKPQYWLLCFLVNNPHPAHLALSELIPPSLSYAGIVLGIRPYYQALLHGTVMICGCLFPQLQDELQEDAVLSCHHCVPCRLIPYRCLNACWCLNA